MFNRSGSLSLYEFFFFFQAEDGIRDYKVTGVQTCALPISFPHFCVEDTFLCEIEAAGLAPELPALGVQGIQVSQAFGQLFQRLAAAKLQGEPALYAAEPRPDLGAHVSGKGWCKGLPVVGKP